MMDCGTGEPLPAHAFDTPRVPTSIQDIISKVATPHATPFTPSWLSMVATNRDAFHDSIIKIHFLDDAHIEFFKFLYCTANEYMLAMVQMQCVALDTITHRDPTLNTEALRRYEHHFGIDYRICGFCPAQTKDSVATIRLQ